MSKILENLEQRESLAKITEELANFFENKDNVQFKTDLSDNQIRAIIRAEYLDYIIKTFFDIDLKLKEKVTEPLKEHLVSKKRKGREEFFEALKSLIGFEQKQQSGIKGLLGL